MKNRELDSAVVYYQQYFDFVEEPAAEDLLKLGKCYYNLLVRIQFRNCKRKS